MDRLLLALGPAFAAGVAVQRALDVLRPLIDRVVSAARLEATMIWLSLLAGLVFAFFGGLRVLQPMGFTGAEWVDIVISALFISSGTESFNSIIKFLGYAKASQKAAAGK